MPMPWNSRRDPETQLDTEDARAGKTGQGVRYVLAASLVLVVGGMLAALFYYGNIGATP